MQCLYCAQWIGGDNDYRVACSFHPLPPHLVGCVGPIGAATRFQDIGRAYDEDIAWPCCGKTETVESFHGRFGPGCTTREAHRTAGLVAVVGDEEAVRFLERIRPSLVEIGLSPIQIAPNSCHSVDWSQYLLVLVVFGRRTREFEKICSEILLQPKCPPIVIPDLSPDAGAFERQVLQASWDNPRDVTDKIREVLRSVYARDAHNAVAARIFLSYSRRGRLGVWKLDQWLHTSSAGPCWLDTRNLKSGVRWSQEIADAIRICNLFVLMLDATIRNDSYVWRELREAITAERDIFAIFAGDSRDIPTQLIESLKATGEGDWYQFPNGELWMDSMKSKKTLLVISLRNNDYYLDDSHRGSAKGMARVREALSAL